MALQLTGPGCKVFNDGVTSEDQGFGGEKKKKKLTRTASCGREHDGLVRHGHEPLNYSVDWTETGGKLLKLHRVSILSIIFFDISGFFGRVLPVSSGCQSQTDLGNN